MESGEIDGNAVKDSNISDLINVAMRKGKTESSGQKSVSAITPLVEHTFCASEKEKLIVHAQCQCKTSISGEFHDLYNESTSSMSIVLRAQGKITNKEQTRKAR